MVNFQKLCFTLRWKRGMSFFLSDFAVGAPYEDAGVGKVRIFHGSKTGLSSTTAAQVF